jgi:hypothetical protein
MNQTNPLMKKFALFLLLLAAGTTISNAQLVLSFKASTGDTEMDNILTDIHNQAVKDINAFKTTVQNTFNIVNSKVDAALKLLSPGDVYMAAQVSLSVNKPFEEVVKTYSAHKEKGWGAIAKELGIKPGSPEFHAMKKSMKEKSGKGNSGEKSKGNGNAKGKGKKK